MTADDQTDTPTAHSTDLMPATRLSRIVARAIDALVLGVITTAALVAGFIVQWNSDDFYGPGGYGWLTLGAVTGVAMAACYEILTVALSGQTIGKSTVGIKIVSANGQRASVGQSAKRWLFPFAIAATGVTAIGLLWFPDVDLPELLFGSVAHTLWFGLPVMWLGQFVTAMWPQRPARLAGPHRRHHRRASCRCPMSSDPPAGSVRRSLVKPVKCLV